MNATAQPELFNPRAKEANAVELAAIWLVNHLHTCHGFQPAANILRAMNLTVTDDTKRWLRTVRQATQGQVIGGPGFPGYMLLSRMSLEDFTHWKRSMRSQARQMISDTIRTEKLWHQLAAAA